MDVLERMPNQRPVWDAYGHALAAAAGIEFVMRVTCFRTRAVGAMQKGMSEANLGRAFDKILANARKGTFGAVASAYIALHRDLLSDDQIDAINSAVEFRNFLTHHFLSAHIGHLLTPNGLNIMVAECAEFQSCFEALEGSLRATIEFDAVEFGQAALRALNEAPPHPLDSAGGGIK